MIGDELEVRGDVLDVCLLEKPDAAGYAERDVAPRELKLKLERVKVRAVEHYHVLQRDALVAQLERALGDELGLLVRVVAGDQRRLHPGVAHRREFLFKLLRVAGDDGVGAVENLRCAAVVCLDLEHLSVLVALREFEHVAKVCTAPRVDALRVVANRHDVVMPTAEQVDQFALYVVRVLIFVDEDKLKLGLKVGTRLLVFA